MNWDGQPTVPQAIVVAGMHCEVCGEPHDSLWRTPAGWLACAGCARG